MAGKRRTVGWGILGCGRVAERRVAPLFARIPDAQLAAVCSRSLPHARHFADRFDAGAAYSSLDRMLADPSVEAIYVATPHALHAAQAMECLSADKHVLVEKPMATSVADAEAMVKAAESAGRILGVMQQQRYHAAHLHLIRLIDEGTLGKLNLVRVHVGMWYPPTGSWRPNRELTGGGVVIDLGPHALDLMLQLGGGVRRVLATTRSLQFGGDAEDYCAAEFELRNGGAGLVDIAYCCHDYGGRVEAYGSGATFVANGSMQSAGLYQTWLRRGETIEPMHEEASNDCYAAAIEDFTDAVLHGSEPSISMHDGLRVMRLIEAIYASARSGRSVEFPESAG